MNFRSLKSIDSRRLIGPLPACLVLMAFLLGPYISGPDNRAENRSALSLVSLDRDGQFINGFGNETSSTAGTAGENQPSGIPSFWRGGALSVVKPDNSRRKLSPFTNYQTVLSTKRHSVNMQITLATLARVSHKLCYNNTMLGLKPSGTS